MRTGFAASLPAVYDYYPFGQPVKERTVRDTATQVAYVTQTVAVPAVSGVSSAPNQNGLILWGHNASLVPGPQGSVFFYGNDGAWGKNLSGLTPNVAVSLTVGIGYVAVAPVVVSVTQTVGGVTTTLASVSGNSAASYLLSFTPTAAQVQVNVSLNHSLTSAANLFSVTSLYYSQVTGVNYVPQLVQLSSGGDDKYEFGFNGQMKTNEIAGLGNHNTALYWEYDTRTARRWNRDPVVNPSMSSYAVFGGNPIMNNDVNGDVFDKASKEPLARFKSETKDKMAANMREIYSLADKLPNASESDRAGYESKIEELQGANKEFSAALKEIGVMEKSTQVYGLRERLTNLGTVGPNSREVSAEQGRTYYETATKKVIMENTIESISHELKHGYQFQIGLLSYPTNGSNRGGFINSVQNEQEAYTRENAYSPSSYLRSMMNANTILSRNEYSALPTVRFNSSTPMLQVYSHWGQGDIVRRSYNETTWSMPFIDYTRTLTQPQAVRPYTQH